MKAFEVHDLITELDTTGKPYLEFLRVADMSAGLYRLASGSLDLQLPHTEDEVYYVVSGRARIRVGVEDRMVTGGSLVYVPKMMEHKFHSIEEELTVLVFFAPAERSGRSPA